MAGLVIDDGIKESDYGYVLRVSGPRECFLRCTRGWGAFKARAGNGHQEAGMRQTTLVGCLLGCGRVA